MPAVVSASAVVVSGMPAVVSASAVVVSTASAAVVGGSARACPPNTKSCRLGVAVKPCSVRAAGGSFHALPCMRYSHSSESDLSCSCSPDFHSSAPAPASPGHRSSRLQNPPCTYKYSPWEASWTTANPCPNRLCGGLNSDPTASTERSRQAHRTLAPSWQCTSTCPPLVQREHQYGWPLLLEASELEFMTSALAAVLHCPLAVDNFDAQPLTLPDQL
eukprot:388111-Rhodomonas_salina.1